MKSLKKTIFEVKDIFSPSDFEGTLGDLPLSCVRHRPLGRGGRQWVFMANWGAVWIEKWFGKKVKLK